MQDILFYIFGALTLGCGLLVVLNPFSRNPVTSAMFLVMAMISLAALFVLLEAFFLAAVQVLVYAGAVMVLFLFVIMLLDLKEESRRKLRWATLGLGLAAVAGVGGVFGHAILNSAWRGEPAGGVVVPGETIPLGKLLFTEYLLPFEVVSVILLVGMVGVILLSKRNLK